MKRRALLGMVILLLAVAFPATGGTKSLDEILDIVDSNLREVQDQTYTGKVQVIRDGVVTKSLEMVVRLKGLQKKLVTFTAPGDVKGMKVLTTEGGNMYVYLPSYKRVRRIASHVRNQGFLGTDFSPEEMGIASLSSGWYGEVLADTETEWLLQLRPEKGNETGYAFLKVWVSKARGGVTQIESYGADGKLKKTQTREAWKTFGTITVPTLFTVINHQTGSKSVLTFSDCQVNTGIGDRDFSKRAIMRSR